MLEAVWGSVRIAPRILKDNMVARQLYTLARGKDDRTLGYRTGLDAEGGREKNQNAFLLPIINDAM
jgi:hypothetical protein